LYSASTRSVSKALRYSTHFQGITQFYMHTLRFIRKENQIYLPLPSQTQLVLIYRPRRDGRLSGPWCEVALAEIRTYNLPIANATLYQTATSTIDALNWKPTTSRLPGRPQKRWTDNVKVTMENRESTLTAAVRNKIYLDRR